LKSANLIAADEVNVNFGAAGAPVQVKVPSVSGVPPSVQDVAKALNLNSSFASSYVAQAASKVTMTGIQFGAVYLVTR
jgi:hypothetical protein